MHNRRFRKSVRQLLRPLFFIGLVSGWIGVLLLSFQLHAAKLSSEGAAVKGAKNVEIFGSTLKAPGPRAIEDWLGLASKDPETIQYRIEDLEVVRNAHPEAFEIHIILARLYRLEARHLDDPEKRRKVEKRLREEQKIVRTQARSWLLKKEAESQGMPFRRLKPDRSHLGYQIIPASWSRIERSRSHSGTISERGSIMT